MTPDTARTAAEIVAELRSSPVGKALCKQAADFIESSLRPAAQTNGDGEASTEGSNFTPEEWQKFAIRDDVTPTAHSRFNHVTNKWETPTQRPPSAADPIADTARVGDDGRCEHGVRHPHPCDDCLDRDIPRDRSLSEHPCYGLSPTRPTEFQHRNSWPLSQKDHPYCSRCGTEIEGVNNRQKDGAPLCWEPRPAATPSPVTDETALSPIDSRAVGIFERYNGRERAGLDEAGFAMVRVRSDDLDRFVNAALASTPQPAVAEGANLEEMPEVAAIRYLNDLRSEYGSAVTILCDDEEAMSRDKQMAIEVCSDWTQWAPRRFYGESILQCAAKAVQSRDALAAIRQGQNEEGR